MQDNGLIEKWEFLLKDESLTPINNRVALQTTAQLLENTANNREGSATPLNEAMSLDESTAPTNITSGVQNYDPVLIAMVRRTAPQLVAYDMCGVQAMKLPTGLIFALRARYGGQEDTNPEAFYNEPNTAFSSVVGGDATKLGDNHGPAVSVDDGGASNGVYNFAGGMETVVAERLGSTGNPNFNEMAIEIESIQVRAKSRALKAEYSTEMAQDLRAAHDMSASDLLADILSTEILSNENREIIRTIVASAVPGAQDDTATAGFYDLDTDSNGRWSVERYKGLLYQIEREANAIARETRRGRGNFIICSSDVASALQMTGVLDNTPALADNNNLVVSDVGNIFIGVLSGKYKVYVDQFAPTQYLVVGYRGDKPLDAGIFYCPYVPLQKYTAGGENTFQPKIAFKTRYGIVANPFADGIGKGGGEIKDSSNVYFRRVVIQHLA